MPQSLANVLLRTIFSTKNREPYLSNSALRAELHAYLGGVTHKLDCTPLCIGGVADHVHLLTKLPRTLTISV
jgi:REP element-mobilizing transposase RayT